jgi:hypothetical protein
MEGAEESQAFVNMMNEMEDLKSPLYKMFKNEKDASSNIIKILKGKIIILKDKNNKLEKFSNKLQILNIIKNKTKGPLGN